MIGEHELAAGFNSFWNEALPLLTPACVTVFNRSYGAYLEGFRPIDVELALEGGTLRGPDLLAEVAFDVFRRAVTTGQRYRDVIEGHQYMDAWDTAVGVVQRHRRVGDEAPPKSGSIAHRYLVALGRRYEAVAELYAPFEPRFSPLIGGCGFLGACEADIVSGDTLFEIKTVNRNFSSKDIRQVIIYLALKSLSGDSIWNRVVLFNPRRSFYANFEPKEFLTYVSAGKGVSQVFRELEALLLHRDFNPEHRF